MELSHGDRLRIGLLVLHCLTSTDKQNMNIFLGLYLYIATRLASCISSENRYTYVAYHFQTLKSRPPFERRHIFTMYGAGQHHQLINS